MCHRGIRVCWALLLLAGTTAPAQARSLYWEELRVDARLDAAGHLRVTERQHMVFDGAWNGGERVFNLRKGEKLLLESIRRINPSDGKATDLRQDNLSRVDDYSMPERNVLRWRSRLPEDPPFYKSGIIYEIEYTLSGIVRREGDGYLLDHDFAFTERTGIIKNFRLNFTLDPAWSAKTSFLSEIARSNLQPGEGVAVILRLTHDGSTEVHVQGAFRENPDAPAAGSASIGILVALFLIFLAWRILDYLRHERRSGLFLPMPDLQKIDEAWLEENVFKYPPEKIGSLWDENTGTPEVAAIIARLEQEKKLRSRVERRGFWIFKRDVLLLELLQPRTEFKDYEAALIKALFVQGDITDSDAIRSYYKKKRRGFNPASKISRWLRADKRISENSRKALKKSSRSSFALIVLSLICLFPLKLSRKGRLYEGLRPRKLNAAGFSDFNAPDKAADTMLSAGLLYASRPYSLA